LGRGPGAEAPGPLPKKLRLVGAGFKPAPAYHPWKRRRRRLLVTTDTELMAMAAAARAGVAVMRHKLLLTNKVIVVCVAADPKPQHAILNTDSQGAIRYTDADGPETANLFEMQGGVAGIVFQQRQTFAGKLLNRFGETS